MTTASYKNYSALEAAELRVREAGEWLKLEDGLIETIVAPRRIIKWQFHFDETMVRAINSLVGGCITTPLVAQQKVEFDITKT